MMGGRTPETCWAVNKRQDNKLENCCIWLVICLNCTMMHGLTNFNLQTCFDCNRDHHQGVSNNTNKINIKLLIFLGGKYFGVMVNILVTPCCNTMLVYILYKQVKFKLLLKQVKYYLINCRIFWKKNKLLNGKCVFRFSLQVLSEIFLFISERWDGSQDPKLLLHDSHVALPT